MKKGRIPMAKRLLTECPYCHRKVSFFGAAILKTRGEHCCSGCKCISNVVINKTIYGIASAAVVLSFLILFLYSMFGDHGNIWGIFYVLAPFLVFYLIVPYFVRLEPCNDKSAVKKLHRKISPIPEEKTESFVQEQPIDLDIGDDFSSSFMKVKSSIKNEQNEDPDFIDSRIIDENEHVEDISSGLDIDITGSMNNTEDYAEIAQQSAEEETAQETAEDNTQTDQSQETQAESDEKKDDGKDETAKGADVSFIFGNGK